MLSKIISYIQKHGFHIKLTGGILLIFIVLQAIFYTFSKSNQNFIESNQLVGHTREVLLKSEQTFSEIKDIESSTRGYVITGNDVFLKPFTKACSAILIHIPELKNLTSDNLLQQARIDSLLDLVNKRISFSNRQIGLTRNKEFEDAKNLTNSGEGETIMNHIRELIPSIQNTENELLRKRQAEREHNITVSSRIVYFLEVMIVIILLGVFIIIEFNFTARKRVENKLEQLNEELVYHVNQRTEWLTTSEEKYRRVVENINDAIIIDDIDGKIIFANDKYLSLFKFSKEDLTNLNLEDYVANEYKNVLRERHNKRIRGEEVPTHFEYQARNKKGELFWVEVSVVPIIENNVIIGTQSFIRDISERKKAEEKLEQSEKKYRQLFENNPMPMWIIDRVIFKFLDVNEAAIKHYGYSRSEFLSMTAVDIRPDEEKRVFVEMDHSKEAENLNRGIWRHKKKDGTIIYVEIIVNNILFEGNQVSLILANDVTVKINAEEKIKKLNEELEQKVVERTAALKKSNELFENLFKHNPGAITISRLSDAEILNVNEAFLFLFGFTNKEEVIGKTARELNIVALPEQREELANLLKENQIIKDFEIKTFTKQGNVFWVSTSILIIDVDGTPCLFSISVDISNRKKAEEQLKAVNDELESFTYSVSHDLRAPLRSINGFTQVLMDQYNEKLDSEAKRYMNIVMDNANKMGQLIDDLLTFSRLGKQNLQKKKLDMNVLVNSIVAEIVKQNATDKIELHIESLPPAYGDENMIKQAIINLISNALKYSSKKEKQLIEIGSYRENKSIVYYIKDNGAGFDMAFYDKLFGVFQRLHSSKEFSGTGVGLSIVHRIIKKHDGKVWANAVVNEGATFYFSLPEGSNDNKTI